MAEFRIAQDLVATDNDKRATALKADYEALGATLVRRGVDIAAVTRKVAEFFVAVPSWGVGTGGTRFARFPGTGEPRGIFDKLDDCAVINQLTQATPNVSLHIPWDKADARELKAKGDALGLGFDAMNSNTFSDAPGQAHSYKYGSLSHTDAATRAQAVEHNLECIEIGKALGSKALTVWIGDGSNFPGQSHFTKAFERYLASMADIYKALPDDWKLFSEHKMYELSLLFHHRAGLGHQLSDRPDARPQGLLPRRSRSPCAEHQYRDDRRPPDPVRQARRFPLQ